jgi:acyl-CoA synthetase (AMP-forming)/AMP-acid ligase II
MAGGGLKQLTAREVCITLNKQGESEIITLLDYVEKNARVYPEKTLFVFEDERCTFNEFKERVYRSANALLQLGIKKGDRVGIIMENCIEYPELYFALGKIGGVTVGFNHRLLSSELAYLVNHCEANTLIVGKEFVEKIAPFRDELNLVKDWICLGAKPEGMLNYEELVSSATATKPEIEVSLDDLHCLLYTGGTTGRPKGVMLPYRHLENTALSWIVEMGLYHDDINLITGPFFHSGGLWWLWAGMMLGNTHVILKRFDVESVLRTIEKERVTYCLWLSSLVPWILNYPDFNKFDLSSLRVVALGGGALGEPQLRKLVEMLPGRRLCHVGGQTETAALCGIRLDEHLDGPPERLGSAGQEIFNMKLRVVDEHDKDVPPGGVGELCGRGDSLMLGYWKMPEETAEAMRGGWQHTGDLVRIDEDGYIYYVDRIKDMIKSGGENVYSKEVEDIIYAHPAVAEVAVIGIPDERWGEAVKAVVKLKSGQTATSEEIIAHCKKRIAGFKCPKSIDFVDDFPRTGLGKIAKPVLREGYWKGYEKRVH